MKDNNTDKPLTTKKRKSLKKSQFCGPNKSFPVPDCAHVTSARRLIGRAKVSSSTKAKIMACVNRKAKSMGCDTKDQITELEAEAIAQSEEFDDTRDLIEFLEELEKDYEQAELIKDRAIIVLSTLRKQPIENAKDNYGQRTLYSLLDSIFDHLEGV